MQEVTGSSPVPRTKSLGHLRCHRLFFCCIAQNRQGRCRKRDPSGRILYAPAEVYPAASGHGRIWNPPLRFLVAAEPPHRGGAPREVFSLWSKARSVGAHSICARGSLPCRKRARADMESAPTFLWRAAPLAEAAKGRVFACCACKRIYFRFRLVKNHLMWYTISLQVHRQTRCKPATQSYRGPSGQPVANKKLLFYCRR